ncbi:hypothetical protein IEQ_05038 [Bacillus cereus BAG6X1-2]|nr:hypothetical protein IEQ_05038 [Bacillus cereus BAG6X1-2]
MAVYLITYDLHKFGQDYKGLHQKIKSLGENIHPLESTWIVSSNHDSKEIYNTLKPSLDSNDCILIVKIQSTSDYYGLLNKAYWSWLKTHID